MEIQVGFELIFHCSLPTPMILMLSIHHTRTFDIFTPNHLLLSPPVPITGYRDMFGNWCSRIVAPQGRLQVTSNAMLHDSGLHDVIVHDARQYAVEDMPEDTLIYLLSSRYCETELLAGTAWQLFGHVPPGWARVQAVCDFVHNHITFGYEHARPTKTAWQVFHERQGVCRDFAHLGITLCRALNIPARYCTGYLGDVGMTPPFGPMDFAGWFEAYLGGHWYTFDPRNNIPRIGRVLIARGRDACDVAISTSFGYNTLESFRVWTDEMPLQVEAMVR